MYCLTGFFILFIINILTGKAINKFNPVYFADKLLPYLCTSKNKNAFAEGDIASSCNKEQSWKKRNFLEKHLSNSVPL